MNIWTYWENPIGKSMPPYIQLCLDSLKRQNPDLIILTPETLSKYIDNLHPNFSTLGRIAHRADCIRVAIVEKHGGWWIDADTVGLRPIENLKIASSSHLLYSRWKDGRVLNGYFYGQRKSPIMVRWLEYINTKLFFSRGDVSWTAFGEGILTPLVFDPKYKDNCIEIPLTTFLPLDINASPRTFFDNVSHEPFIKENSICFGLNHSWFNDHVPDLLDMSVETIIESNTLIGSLFNKTKKELR